MRRRRSRKGLARKRPPAPEHDPRLDALEFPPQEKQTQYSLAGRIADMPLVTVCGYNDSKGIGVVEWHSHPGIELILVLDGRTVREIQGGKSFQFIGGQFFVVPPGVKHRPQWNPNRPCKLCWLAFDPGGGGATRNTPFTRQDLTQLDRQFRSAQGSVTDASKRLMDLLKLLRRTLSQWPGARGGALPPQGRRPADRRPALRLRILLSQILLESANCLGSREAVHENEYVHAAQEYMRSHLREDLRFSQVARHVGFGKSWLYRQFKAATGLTPNDYLVRVRHVTACELLKNTPKSVTAIAMEVGYSSSQYFCRVFRRYSGQTPTAFRRAVRTEKN
jgi:AraC-like DNA-binding protein/mannose-6-phosphate isomerase-like protein (cupin superfamily)